MAYSQSNHTQMSQLTKCLGAEAPKFYMIKYNDIYTIVAMRMADQYLFNVPNSDGQKSWQSVSKVR